MNRQLPLVTLGICVKNNASTIKMTIESILTQDFPLQNLQLIVVDGLSSDNTLDIIRTMLKDLPVNWILLCDEGKGLAYAREIVVNHALGEYVIWVDGDHVLYPDFVSKHVDFMEKNPDIGGAGGVMEYIATNIVSKLEGYSWYLYCLKRLYKDLDTLGGAGAIYRISAVKAVGGYDTRIRGAGEDNDISLRIKKAGWKLKMNPNAKFKHIMRTRWRSLWKEYSWWGYGSHFISHKHSGVVNPYRFLPPIAFIAGIRLGIEAYRTFRDISSVIIPFHYAWKRTAWIWGFLRAHIDGYGHDI
jgi:cellulose synthase/poly-beta-1,6-N-acetylglucosamine synthase-like glycosyltransferase